jgi:hypothetical protein
MGIPHESQGQIEEKKNVRVILHLDRHAGGDGVRVPGTYSGMPLGRGRSVSAHPFGDGFAVVE